MTFRLGLLRLLNFYWKELLRLLELHDLRNVSQRVDGLLLAYLKRDGSVDGH